MNNDIKISFTIILPGSTMYSNSECYRTVKKSISKQTKGGKYYKVNKEVIEEDPTKFDKTTVKRFIKGKTAPEIITVLTRKSKPATQTINLRQEAYDYMVSNERPNWANKEWSNLNKMKRLEQHLQRIAEHFNGDLLSYTVFED